MLQRGCHVPTANRLVTESTRQYDPCVGAVVGSDEDKKSMLYRTRAPGGASVGPRRGSLGVETDRRLTAETSSNVVDVLDAEFEADVDAGDVQPGRYDYPVDDGNSDLDGGRPSAGG